MCVCVCVCVSVCVCMFVCGCVDDLKEEYTCVHDNLRLVNYHFVVAC